MEHYEEGLLTPESLIILENSISEALDVTAEPLHDWDVLRALFNQNGCMIRMGLKCQQWCCIAPLINRILFSKMRLVYDVYQNFVVCSNHALTLLEHVRSIDEEDVKTVREEVMHNIDEANHRITSLRSGYPTVMRHVDLQHCEYFVLKQFTGYYAKMAHSGELDAKHHELIDGELNRKIASLKTKLTIEKSSLDKMARESTLKNIFGETAVLNSLKRQGILVKPAHLIGSDGKSHCVTEALCSEAGAQALT